MTVNLDDGCIDHCIFEVRLIRAGFKKLCEHIGSTPVAEATECCAPVSKMLGEITPRRTGPHDPKNSFNEKSVVAAATPGIARLAQAMRLHLRPLGVCKNKSIHQKLESHQANLVNLEGSVRSAGRACGIR
jgi:hypothetical protein